MVSGHSETSQLQSDLLNIEIWLPYWVTIFNPEPQGSLHGSELHSSTPYMANGLDWDGMDVLAMPLVLQRGVQVIDRWYGTNIFDVPNAASGKAAMPLKWVLKTL